MPFVVPPDVEALLVNHLRDGRYSSGDEVLRSAMLALTEVDQDLSSVEQAIEEWRAGDSGTALADAFQAIRTGKSSGSTPG